MEVRYQLTADDLLQAIRGSYRGGWVQRVLRSLVIAVVAAFVGFAALATLRGRFDSIPTVLVRAWPDIVALAALIVIVWTALNHWWLIPKATRRLFGQMKSMQLRKELSVEERGLRFRDANDNWLVPWDHIQKWRDTNAHLLIYLTDSCFVVVPKRAFADSLELEQLKSLLSTRVPSR